MQLRKRDRQAAASAAAPAPVCLSDLNVLPLWGSVLNADANAPLTLNHSHSACDLLSLPTHTASSHAGEAMYSHTQMAQEPSCCGNCSFEVAHCDVITASDLKSFCVW